MMAAPAMHSFMSHLFAEASFETVHDGFARKGDEKVATDDEENRTLSSAISVVYRIDDIQRMIEIVQDNACIHATPPPNHPLYYKGNLDMSTSETRWSNDTSIEQSHLPAAETSITNKPRFPRRLPSVDDDASAVKKKNKGLPRFPQRKATVEFVSPPAAAAGGSSSSHTSKTNNAPTPPRKPQRKGTIDLSNSIEEEKEEENSSPGPPTPIKRLDSNNHTTIQNHNHCGNQENININPTASPATNTGRYSRRQRIPRRRATSPIPPSATDDLPPRRSSAPTEFAP